MGNNIDTLLFDGLQLRAKEDVDSLMENLAINDIHISMSDFARISSSIKDNNVFQYFYERWMANEKTGKNKTPRPDSQCQNNNIKKRGKKKKRMFGKKVHLQEKPKNPKRIEWLEELERSTYRTNSQIRYVGKGVERRPYVKILSVPMGGQNKKR